jgi:hypothetical protein
MKRHRLAAHFALAALAVMGLASSATAGKQVPFKGRLDGVVTHSPIDALHDQVDVDATGCATHLGRFSLDIPHIVNHTNGTAIGTYEFTTANGDTVFAEFTGQATPTSTPGVLYIVETATITWGTGRFAGASGSFICERLFDRIAGTTSGSFEGTISSPGSGNP